MIKIGLCGTGFMGRMHVACYNAMPGVKIVAVADKRPEFLKKAVEATGAKVYADAKDLVKNADIDVADICLPTYLHAEHAILAARRGLACMCEKPMAINTKEADRMVAEVNKAKIPFMVGQVIRFWPEYVKLKEYYDKKTLGKLLALSMVRVSCFPIWTWDNWIIQGKRSGNAALDLHIHDADFIRYLLGEPADVHTVGAYARNGWDYIFTNYRYPGMAVSAESGWNMPAGYPFEMNFRAVFEKGTLAYSSLNRPLTLYKSSGKSVTVKLPQPKVKAGSAGGNISSHGGYFIELQYFIDCVRRGKKPERATVEDGRDSVALVEREIASATRNAKRK